MYLKSLTLKGFKSFAQPTTFAFEPGVTCVVGPNGSGKSNVVDALAWVMGEQGAKTLRGGKMEDVIFAGTSTRGPLGRAEVTLTIDNSDGALPIEYSEVTISRTLFRNGGSEYAINGEGCRLLDVQELLSDSGLGREMHVIVGQGRLDNVLHASPEERRGFIEEAAGILKHRRRKEKTLRKLEAMQANLTRLNDLAGELRRQLKPLGHQAEIAREAQTIAAIVRDARARLLADEVVQLRAAITEFSRTEHERKSERIVLQEQADQARLRQNRLEQAMSGDAVDAARRVAFALEQVQERLRSLYSLANQKLALLGQQAELPGMQSTVSQQMVDDARSEAERLRGDIAQAEGAVARAAAATATAKASLDSLDEEISAQSALVSQHDLELARLASKTEVAQSSLAAARGESLRHEHSLEQAQQRLKDARGRYDEFEAQRHPDQEPADAELDETQSAAEEQVVALQSQLETAREALHADERERDALAARSSALSRALDSRSATGGLVDADLPGLLGPVADHVQVQPGFEAAVAAALGTLAEALLASDAGAAHAALEHAAANDLGRVELVVADAAAHAPQWPEVAGLQPAASVVTAPSGVLGVLGHVTIADDLGAARKAVPLLRQALGTVPVTLVTRDGDVLTEHVLRGGSGGSQGRIELLAERDAAAERLVEVTAAVEQRRSEVDALREALSAAKQRAAAAAEAVRDRDRRLAAHTEQLGRARVQLEAAEAECERLQAARDRAAESARVAEAAVDRARAEHEEYAARPRPILDVSARDGMVAELDRARAAELQARVELETARERVRAEQQRADELSRQLDAERDAAREQARLAVLRQRQIAAAASVIEALPPVLNSVDRSVADARVRLAAAEAERAAQNEELSELRRTESALRERLHAASEQVHGLEMQLYEKKLHLSSLLERAGDELGLVEDVLVAEYGPHVPVPVDKAPGDTDAAVSTLQREADAQADDAQAGDAQAGDARSSDGSADGGAAPEREVVAFDRAAQQRRLAAAERKYQQLGRVNPLALEEFAALEQRHKFLTEQLADLTQTRKDLLAIIDELDGKMQEIFEAAFEDTRTAFNEVFPVLFPGGTGSLQLTNPDDLLTTGIEVTVKPAGKKIERLSLLSGGERSLAAVALLIAIFKARPSPFYIMDEVEAALDDANLGRLLTIFEDLRESSQLIVITHQKRTMEIADALYGVSMRQDGVSAVVGQRVRVEERSA
ncbi:chromosome segregation protein SMC [Ruicaihuangia caeni]|uniref:Chromosome partition protein Smc n=1 Tax=Ruicaihuangia caeni TaxID=3042517 RepID=A0AAW6T2N9_9MICO|nr:chromosome segregation protein SMC [Klugiella sp. YN-L-19]MDI2097694.1 chromosome segregation protein SMC [Klugiella sp. YN-L-19]